MAQLYLVGTPIGNLEDLSPRAQRILQQVNFVVAEDTRRTRRLLKHFDIGGSVESLHAHSDKKKVDYVVSLLEDGDVAYVTDAGTPGLSDPGAILVKAARTSGHAVVPVPGPSALSTALSVSGFESTGATFLGFLPERKSKRLEILDSALSIGLPIVIFVGPKAVMATVIELSERLGEDTQVTICRELTKMHEQVVSCAIGKVINEPVITVGRGEYTLVVNPGPVTALEISDRALKSELKGLFDKGMTHRDASIHLAAKHSISRGRVYKLGIEIQDD
tara:strand:- start:1069 stop:1899 length:831 start_codon:yes stop_codon:yes gene_type:complete